MPKCLFCNRLFISKPRQVFCSHTCRGLSQNKKVGRKCKICEKVFLVPPSRKQIYCSVECLNTSRLLTCEKCGKRFAKTSDKRKRFCSAECRRLARPSKGVTADGNKICFTCKIPHSDKIPKTGKFYSYCRDCRSKDSHQRLLLRKTDPNKKERIKRKSLIDHLRYQFGMSLEEFEKLFKAQNGRCKICGKTQEENNKRLSIDHCHKTGKIRGLLCNNCNRGLGLFKDNPALLESALSYLNAES
jgi:hypothetical protein